MPDRTVMFERARAMRPLIWAGITVLVILGLIIFPYTVMPYDVLWSEIAQKLHLA